MATISKQWLLASRPAAEATVGNFRLVETPVPALAEGQVLVRHHYLARPLHAHAHERRQELRRAAAAERGDDQLAARWADGRFQTGQQFAAGDKVVVWAAGSSTAWSMATHPGPCAKVDTTCPALAYLGAVGMPGVTAWYGLADHAAQGRRTIVVSAANGAVGSAVGQLARCAAAARFRASPAAPTSAATAVVVELGFDACVDYKQHRRSQVLETLKGGARTASTATSRTSAAWCSTPCCATNALRPHGDVRDDQLATTVAPVPNCIRS